MKLKPGAFQLVAALSRDAHSREYARQAYGNMPGRHAGIAPAGINIDWQNPKGDPFWINEPIALMQALVLYSSRHLKDICDIPHIFSFAAHSSEEEIAKLVSKDVDYSNYAASFTSALAKKDVGGQVAGVWSGIKSVARKASVGPLIMWVLSGDEVDFNLNRPEQPTLLCIVNNSLKQKVIAPFVLLVATVCRTTMNVKKRHKSIFLLDEAPTLYLPEFDQLPNTGRSNKIAKEIANKLIRLRAHSMV